MPKINWTDEEKAEFVRRMQERREAKLRAKLAGEPPAATVPQTPPKKKPKAPPTTRPPAAKPKKSSRWFVTLWDEGEDEGNGDE